MSNRVCNGGQDLPQNKFANWDATKGKGKGAFFGAPRAIVREELADEGIVMVGMDDKDAKALING